MLEVLVKPVKTCETWIKKSAKINLKNPPRFEMHEEDFQPLVHLNLSRSLVWLKETFVHLRAHKNRGGSELDRVYKRKVILLLYSNLPSPPSPSIPQNFIVLEWFFKAHLFIFFIMIIINLIWLPMLGILFVFIDLNWA